MKYMSKMPWSLDPFIHPLITEIEDAFIDGISTYIANMQ